MKFRLGISFYLIFKKNTMFRSFVILFLITLIYFPITGQTETCLQNLNDPNLKTIKQANSGDTIIREYVLHVPTSYDSGIASPLVINLHGFGDCATDFAESVGGFYNFEDLANEENIIVAYPQGAYRPEKEDTYWEPGDNGSESIYENDVYFLKQLVLDISSDYNLDMSNVFAIGYSNGGMMAYSLACNASELFSGIGIMSGALLDDACSLENAVPIITFHGIADGVLPYDGNQWYRSVSEVVDFWLDLNNIPASSIETTSFNDGNAVRDAYSGGSDASCLQLYTIHEEFDKPGDHVWFSEALEGISPNRIMWNFFMDNCSATSSTNKIDENVLKIKLSPNPFVDQINIESLEVLHETYSIYNVNGQLELAGQINTIPYTIDLSNSSSNMYFIKIGEHVRKIIKTQ